MVKGLNPTIIEQIESICAERGVRLTPQRRRVFELICSNRRASSAYELLEQLKESEPQAKPPTVYRALDFLLEQGLSTEWNRQIALLLVVLSILNSTFSNY